MTTSVPSLFLKHQPTAQGLNPLYTIGYGNRKFPDFLQLLKEYGINVLVDVRRFPTSKFPEYVRENLEGELPKLGIRYVYIGDGLGGFRRGGYESHMKTEQYARGIEALLEIIRKDNVVIMCIERSPKACHRRFVSKTLEDLGIKVIHIIDRVATKH